MGSKTFQFVFFRSFQAALITAIPYILACGTPSENSDSSLSDTEGDSESKDSSDATGESPDDSSSGDDPSQEASAESNNDADDDGETDSTETSDGETSDGSSTDSSSESAESTESSEEESSDESESDSESASSESEESESSDSNDSSDDTGDEDECNQFAYADLTVIDGTGSDPRTDSVVIVQGENIKEIVDDVPSSIPDDCVLSLPDHFLLPGLIDAHTHLTQGESTSEGDRHLSKIFAQGVTSVRDMAGNGPALKTLQENAKENEVSQPRVYFSSLVAGQSFLDSDPRVKAAAGSATPGEVPWLARLDENTDVDKLASDAKAFGVTGVKMYDAIAPAVAKSFAEAASKVGLQVWSHAYVGTTSHQDLVDAKVNALSHADMLRSKLGNSSQGFYEDMVAAGTALDATLGVYDGTADGKKIAKEAHEAGVRIVLGTDVAVDVPQEFALLIEAGIPALQAIRAATANNAYVLGMDQKLGTVEANMRADLLIVGKDPLASPENIKEVQYVVKGGMTYDCRSGSCKLLMSFRELENPTRPALYRKRIATTPLVSPCSDHVH